MTRPAVPCGLDRHITRRRQGRTPPMGDCRVTLVGKLICVRQDVRGLQRGWEPRKLCTKGGALTGRETAWI